MKRLVVAVLFAMSAFAEHAVAQSFPERTITLINPYAAGGPADLLARTVADGMSETLGRPVVVENRPGAGTAIGARAVAQANPDGYTLFLGGSPSHVITPALMKDANYDGIKDFTPITTVANVPNMLVVPPGRAYKSVKDLVAAAKDANGKMTFASIGVGSIPQFLGVLFQLRAGVTLVDVPYKGAAPASVDLLGGRIDMAFLNVPGRFAPGAERPVARTRCCQCDAGQGASRYADDGRSRIPERRHEHLVRHFGAGQNAARGRQQALCSHRPDAQFAESEGKNRSPGRRDLS